MSNKVILVGLAGGSATGKTSIINHLLSHFDRGELAVLSQDNYYKPLSQQLRDERGVVNFDHPAGIDFRRLLKDVRKLKSGKVVEIVEYTFNDPSKFPKPLRVEPAAILIVEGLFIYSDPRLKKMFNWRLFVETEVELAKSRRLERDVKERGMRSEDVHYQWEKHVVPAFDEHVVPHLDDVHLFVDNNSHFEQSLKEVIFQLEEFLDKGEFSPRSSAS